MIDELHVHVLRSKCSTGNQVGNCTFCRSCPLLPSLPTLFVLFVLCRLTVGNGTILDGGRQLDFLLKFRIPDDSLHCALVLGRQPNWHWECVGFLKSEVEHNYLNRSTKCCQSFFFKKKCIFPLNQIFFSEVAAFLGIIIIIIIIIIIYRNNHRTNKQIKALKRLDLEALSLALYGSGGLTALPASIGGCCIVL